MEQNPDGRRRWWTPAAPKGAAKAGIGLLTLVTVPPAAVFDGATSLGTTPLQKLPLQVGTYRLRVVGSEGDEQAVVRSRRARQGRRSTDPAFGLPPYRE